jgi:anti-anti-sigma regulatory factor
MTQKIAQLTWLTTERLALQECLREAAGLEARAVLFDLAGVSAHDRIGAGALARFAFESRERRTWVKFCAGSTRLRAELRNQGARDPGEFAADVPTAFGQVTDSGRIAA